MNDRDDERWYEIFGMDWDLDRECIEDWMANPPTPTFKDVPGRHFKCVALPPRDSLPRQGSLRYDLKEGAVYSRRELNSMLLPYRDRRSMCQIAYRLHAEIPASLNPEGREAFMIMIHDDAYGGFHLLRFLIED